jgi:uncharacterized protein
MLFAEKVQALLEGLERHDSILVALSGGVDSAVLLGAAARARPGRVHAATTRSNAVPDEEIEAARRLAGRFGVPHHLIETRELDDPRYRANRGDRCYFCRVEMYDGMRDLAAREGIAAIADGVQAEDSADDRPGMRAARERGLIHPLRESGFSKPEIRRLALALGLGEVQDKPAQPCLASRLPVGVEVTRERLARVERAERALRDLGFRELRVRCEDAHGRIEIGVAELPRARQRERELVAATLAAGFETAALDPVGYRSGGAGLLLGGR